MTNICCDDIYLYIYLSFILVCDVSRSLKCACIGRKLTINKNSNTYLLLRQSTVMYRWNTVEITQLYPNELLPVSSLLLSPFAFFSCFFAMENIIYFLDMSTSTKWGQMLYSVLKTLEGRVRNVHTLNSQTWSSITRLVIRHYQGWFFVHAAMHNSL